MVYAIEGRDHPVLRQLTLFPSDVRNGQVWRIVTWPLANVPDVFQLLAIAMLWYFGSRLEATVGRVKMAAVLVAVIVVPGLAGTLLDVPQGGVRVVELVVLLLFVAEYPHVRFFFGIPGWVLGVAIVALEFLQLAGDRQGRSLLFYLVALATGAVAGRSAGLLSNYSFIPRVPVGAGRTTGGRQGRARKPKGRAVVQGPWGETGYTPHTSNADQTELDVLLDKISASGMDSLNRAEKQRLNDLSKRLRGG